jgi:dTDP-4-amino-4,6-dideoxygalactose transaminase
MIPRLQIEFPLRYQKEFWFGKPYAPAENEFLLNHARSGILLALKAAELPANTSVGVMVYNCHTVANAVEQAGLKPVFIDVTDDLKLDFEDFKRKANDISAIVVTHLFGKINDVGAIKQMYPDILVIEDCAHAYGLNSFHGDFAVFSIGQGKHPSIGDGGILKMLNNKYLQNIKIDYEKLPDYSWYQKTRLFVKLLGMAILNNRMVYGWLTLPMKRKRAVKSGRSPVIPMKMCRGISNIYSAEKDKVVPRDVFMQVLYCENPKVEQELYRKKGIDTDTHFANSIIWAKEFGYSLGQCPNAEKLVCHLLMIPTYFNKR